MRAYSKRHYGINTFRLRNAKVIVQHVAQASTAKAVRNTFKHDRRDPELGELPNVCSHFVIGANGMIHKLVRTSFQCRHTVGLNYTSIGIEHVGFSDSDVWENKKVLRASLKLTRTCAAGSASRSRTSSATTRASPRRTTVSACRGFAARPTAT